MRHFKSLSFFTLIRRDSANIAAEIAVLISAQLGSLTLPGESLISSKQTLKSAVRASTNGT